ncbi:MAG TPA: hypothetical protein PLN63_03910 [Paludibacteraceae bacterium]|nr:hypothetical protein [Paludibacteraceae bacterium]HOU68572.1 hypothetical protein [Paludibacteraceae bacterium]HPH62750.1 hypothetical protein [Paludibacteraceae bacterium]HQF50394.1 hypothetical protein [Paludibacteraceae bacterium]HQJ91033.1 hypothetical protein [Paludibacteraceae bacterium]
MKNKTKRFGAIKEIIQTSNVGNQEDLLNLLSDRGFEVTQATLSRDLKQLKVAKITNASGEYVYRLSQPTKGGEPKQNSFVSPNVHVTILFSGNVAVLRTRAGYASGLAYEIDEKGSEVIIGTVAGEDTIIAVMKENVSKERVKKVLSEFIPSLEE